MTHCQLGNRTVTQRPLNHEPDSKTFLIIVFYEIIVLFCGWSSMALLVLRFVINKFVQLQYDVEL